MQIFARRQTWKKANFGETTTHLWKAMETLKHFHSVLLIAVQFIAPFENCLKKRFLGISKVSDWGKASRG